MPHLRPAADAPAPTETALIARVPAAEAVVGAHRRRLDEAAGWGVPAHVTVLYPFVEPTAVDEQLVASLSETVATVTAFDCHFPTTGWFGDEVLWLAPDPAEPFRALTAAVWRAFPGHPPYGGAHADVVPHLTVAERRMADRATLQRVEGEVRPRLPVSARVEEVLLIAGARAPRSWRVMSALPLGPVASVVP